MNEQQSEPKCEATLSNLIKGFHWPRIVTERQAIRIGVKGHGGVDQQGPVTSLLKLGQNERLSEICHDLPERHGALSGSSGSSNWIVTIRLTSIFPMYLRDIVVLENSRKSRRFAIEPNRDESARSRILLPFSLLLLEALER